MKIEGRLKVINTYILSGLTIPALFFVNAFVIPWPYSQLLITIALSPVHLLPFLEDKELLHKTTILIFDRQTPNYAPITILVLTVFWFLIGVIIIFIARFMTQKKN